jgi:hypothetical protein
MIIMTLHKEKLKSGHCTHSHKIKWTIEKIRDCQLTSWANQRLLIFSHLPFLNSVRLYFYWKPIYVHLTQFHINVV